MENNKKLVNTVFIGKNGEKKTENLLNKKNQIENKLKIGKKNIDQNVIYIPTEQNYKSEFEKEKSTGEGNYINKIKSLIELIFGNLNKFSYEINDEELNKIEGRKKFKQEIFGFINNMKDPFFIFKTENIFKDNKRINTLNLDLEQYKTPSGLNNYSLIKLLSNLLLYAKKNNKKINGLNDYYLIIDEPEKFCHPQLIKKIATLLKDVSKDINIIVATHSYIFLNWFLDEENTKINILKKGEVKKEFTWNELKNFLNWNEIYNSDKKNYKILQGYLNNKILRYKIIESFFCDNIVFVEDRATEILLSIIIEDEDFSIVVTMGKSRIEFFFYIFYDFLKYEIKNLFAIFDGDKKKKNERKEINKKIFDLFLEKNIYKFKEDIEADFEEEMNYSNSKDKQTASWIYENENNLKNESKIFIEIKNLLFHNKDNSLTYQNKESENISKEEII